MKSLVYEDSRGTVLRALKMDRRWISWEEVVKKLQSNIPNSELVGYFPDTFFRSHGGDEGDAVIHLEESGSTLHVEVRGYIRINAFTKDESGVRPAYELVRTALGLETKT